MAELERNVREYLHWQKVKLVGGKQLKCPPSGTILRWASERLIPSPSGGTRYASWPEWTWEEIVAAAYLLGKGWGRGRVMVARVLLGSALERGRLATAELDKLWERDSRDYMDAAHWGLLVLKAHCGWPLDSPATVLEDFDTAAGIPQYVAMPPIQRDGEHPVAVDRLVRGDALD